MTFINDLYPDMTKNLPFSINNQLLLITTAQFVLVYGFCTIVVR